MTDKNKEKKELLLVGGQAVIEGVLMRSKENVVVAVRSDKGKIIKKEWHLNPLGKRIKLFNLPFFRGVIVLYETLVVGLKALTFSAKVAAGEDKKGDSNLGKLEMIVSFVLAFAFAILIFILIPLFLANIAAKENNLLFNIFDGLLRLGAFIGYLTIISMFKDVRRIFEYHGAEHMSIHAYEHGEKLIPIKIRKYATMHPRCGTSFLLIVIVVSIIVFSFVTSENFIIRLLSRVILLPLIAGVAYEILRLGAKFEKNIFMKLIVFPGLLLQRITTKEPDNDQIIVAVASLKHVLKMK
jgi:uncharacterized protein YqhQ